MTTVVAAIVLLGVLITVHELGHFLVAKLCGVKVLTFSIGFGPKLVGFTRGDTEYRISVVPFGGYVRMYGDDVTEEVPADQQHRAFLYQPYLKKVAIAVAGPLANFILPIALFFALFVGTEQVPESVIGSVVQESAAARADLREGDRVVALDGTSIRYFDEITRYVQPRAKTPIRFTVERDGKQLDLTVTPDAAPDPDIFDRTKTVGRLGILSSRELPVVVVVPGSAAATAGVKDLDTVLTVNGKAVATKKQLFQALDEAGPAPTLEVERDVEVKEGDDKKTVQQRFTFKLADAPMPPLEVGFDRFGVTADELAPGPLRDRIDRTRVLTEESVQLAAKRSGLAPVDGLVSRVAEETVAFEKGLKPNAHRIVAVDGKRVLAQQDLMAALEQSPDDVHVVGVVGPDGARVIPFLMMPATQRSMGGIKVFGVGLTIAIGPGAMAERNVSPAEALKRGWNGTLDMVSVVFKGFGLLFSGEVGIEAIGGPGTIAKLAGQAAEAGAEPFVELMALISVNLAVLNLLPIPVLDGGHIMLFTVELFTRRRLSAETRMKATKVGLVFVGLLMLIAIGNDILELF